MGNVARIKLICFTFIFILVLGLSLGLTQICFAESQISLHVSGGVLEGLVADEFGVVNLDLSGEVVALPIPVKTGYDFLGWTATDSDEDRDYITSITVATNEFDALYAKYKLANPIIVAHPDNYSEMYDDNVSCELFVSATHPLDGTFSYQWYYNGQVIEGANLNTLEIKNCNQSGEYYCLITFEYNSHYAQVCSNSASVYIEKIDVLYMPQIIIEGVYDDNKTLNDYELPFGYVWFDSTMVPQVNTRLYHAIYNVDDNHYDYNCYITLILEKAQQVVTANNVLAVFDGEEHKISATISGTGTITYSQNNSLTNVGKEVVTVYVSATDNYLATTAYAILEIIPQNVTANWSLTEFVYDGEPHNPSVELIDSQNNILNVSISTPLINAGEYNAIITLDNANYNIINPETNFVILPQHVNVYWDNIEVVYDASIHIPSALAVDLQGNALDLLLYDSQVDAGEYTVYATTQNTNYSLENAYVQFKILKADFDMSNVILADGEFVYDGQEHTLTVENLPKDIDVQFDTTASSIGYYDVIATFTSNNPNYNSPLPMTAKMTILKKNIIGEWYELVCNGGVLPDMDVKLELIEDFSGLTEKNKAKLKYLFGFKIVLANGTSYDKPITVIINYDNIDINNLVLSVDENAQEQIITYAYEQGKLIFTIDDITKNYVLAERTESLFWIIPLVLGLCALVCVIALLINKKVNDRKTSA